jgi:HEAT repeat protein
LRRKGLLLNAGLSLGVTVAFLAALEGAARLVEKRKPPRPEVARYIWDWDEKMPGGFYVMKSDAAGWPPWEEFNADGLRDRTRPREKADLVRRVAILGDSVTLGDGLRPEQAYPQVLEARLAAQGRPLEVMSAALWGWSTRQERIAWQRIARGYRPDAALLAVCLNDIPELFNNLSRPPRWLASLHSRSALARLVVNAEGREIDSVERLFDEERSERVERAMSGFFEEVRALRREAEADGAALALVVFPFRFQVQPGAPRPVVQERIAAFCRAEGLRCLDLLPALAPVGEAAFEDYDHLSPVGSVAVAEAILQSDVLPETEAAPAFLERATAGSSEKGAASLLRWLGASDVALPADAEAALTGLVASADPAVRLAAAWAAGWVRPAPAGTLRDALVEALRRDASTAVRAQAARSLGDAASEAALFDALGDPSEAVRHEAARTLGRSDRDTADVPRLVAALESADDYVAAFAAWSLGNLRAEARDAVPALARALARERTDAVVAGALARIGPAAADAVPTLLEGLRHPDSGRRWRAARTLGRIGPAAAAAAGPLTEALGDASGEVRQHAARALGRLGPAARPSAGALQRATGDPDEAVRREAQQALERLR